MSSFTSPLILKKISARIWELHTPFEYYIGDKEANDIISVPKGFQTDLASIPRLFWIIFPPDGRYTGAAIIHDWGYHIQYRSRKEYDLIFLEAMAVLKVSFWKRRIMYRAVRMFSWIPWNKRAKILKKHSMKLT